MPTDPKLNELARKSALYAEEASRVARLQLVGAPDLTGDAPSMPEIERRIAALQNRAVAVTREALNRIMTDADAIKAQAKTAVEANRYLAKLRDAARALDAATAQLAEQLDAAKSDPDLTQPGRDRKVLDLGQRLRDAVYGVVERYNEDEARFLAGFPPVAPGEVPLSDDDAKRVVVLLNQVPHLDPAEFIGRLGDALGRMDRVVVQALLPLARSFAARPEYRELAAARRWARRTRSPSRSPTAVNRHAKLPRSWHLKVPTLGWGEGFLGHDLARERGYPDSSPGGDRRV
ncbi:MAG: hypothetical protein ACREMM_08740 [Gemmatimonadales bacterium]